MLFDAFAAVFAVIGAIVWATFVFIGLVVGFILLGISAIGAGLASMVLSDTAVARMSRKKTKQERPKELA